MPRSLKNYPSVSIVIPVYNVQDYVGVCIRSVIQQNYSGDVECIIVDDCSPDGSIVIVNEILQSYSGSITFSVLTHEVNRGLSEARNSGMRSAHGEYLLFLDSDDELLPGALSILTSCFPSFTPDLVIAPYRSSEGGVSNLLLRAGEYPNEDLLGLYLKYHWPITAWNKLYKLSFLRESGCLFQTGLLYEDVGWSFQIADKAHSLFVVDKPTYLYNIRINSIYHGTRTDVSIENKARVISLLEAYCIKNRIIDRLDVQSYLFHYKSESIALLELSDIDYSLWRKLVVSHSPDLFLLWREKQISTLRFVREFFCGNPSKLSFLCWKTFCGLISIVHKTARGR